MSQNIENIENVTLVSPNSDEIIKNYVTITMNVNTKTLDITVFDIFTNPQIKFVYDSKELLTPHFNYFNQLVQEKLDRIKRPLNITNMIEFAYRFINHESFIDEIKKSSNYLPHYETFIPIIKKILAKYISKNPQGGGKSVAKILIFGRKRNVIMKGRVKYVKYKGVLQKLSELRKLEKTKH